MKFYREAIPKEVYEKTKEVVLKAIERGNFILSTTDFFFDGTPYEILKRLQKPDWNLDVAKARNC